MNLAQAYTIMFFYRRILYALEILMRGYSHISMLLAGEFVCVSRCCAKSTGWTGITGGADAFVDLMITVVEFVVGMIVNRYLHLAVFRTAVGLFWLSDNDGVQLSGGESF